MLAQAQKITIFFLLIVPLSGGCFESYDRPEDEEGTSTVGTDGATGASSSSSGDGDSTGDGDGDSTGTGDGDGDGESTGTGDGDGAPTEPYEPCLNDGDCQPLWPTCLVAEGSVAGFCTGPCVLAGDCEGGSTGAASPFCHDLGVCLLSCGPEKPCPDGMACANESFDGWPVGGVCTWP